MEVLRFCGKNCDQGERLAKRLAEAPKRRKPASRAPLRRQVRLSEDQQRALVQDHQAGAMQIDLAAQYGVHESTVAAILCRRQVPLRRRSLTSEQKAEAVRLYATGLSLAAVAKEIGETTGMTVRRALLEAGVQPRPPSRRADLGPSQP